MNETREMLKAEVANWVDYNSGIKSRTYKNAAIEEILESYEVIQEWNEDVMTTGAAADEIREWLNNSSTADDLLRSYDSMDNIVSDKIMCGLGFDKAAITDAVLSCTATIKRVIAYAQTHGYEDDAKLLDITYDYRTYDDCFVDMVRDFVKYSYENELYDPRTSFTNRIVACCYNRAASLLEDTRLCKELGVSFGEYAADYASVCKLQLVCSEGTYEDFEDNIEKIFDRLSSAKQEKQSRDNKPVERE